MQALKPALMLIGRLSITLFLLLTALFLFAVPITGILWDWANALGYLAVGIFLLLFIYSGRPKASPPFSGYFFTLFHRDMGYVSLILVSLHIAVLLIKEPLLIEHLKLSAPWYMFSGLLAAILILLLIISSLVKFRSKIWSDYSIFRSFHKWASVTIALLIGTHLIGSGFYLNGVYKGAFFAVIMLAISIYYFGDQSSKESSNQQRIKSSKNASLAIALLLTTLLVTLSLVVVVLKHRFF